MCMIALEPMEYKGQFRGDLADAAASNSRIEKSDDPWFRKMQQADLRATIAELDNRGDRLSASHLRDELLRYGSL